MPLKRLVMVFSAIDTVTRNRNLLVKCAWKKSKTRKVNAGGRGGSSNRVRPCLSRLSTSCHTVWNKTFPRADITAIKIHRGSPHHHHFNVSPTATPSKRLYCIKRKSVPHFWVYVRWVCVCVGAKSSVRSVPLRANYKSTKLSVGRVLENKKRTRWKKKEEERE
jgi:hypothetical protein